MHVFGGENVSERVRLRVYVSDMERLGTSDCDAVELPENDRLSEKDDDFDMGRLRDVVLVAEEEVELVSVRLRIRDSDFDIVELSVWLDVRLQDQDVVLEKDRVLVREKERVIEVEEVPLLVRELVLEEVAEEV